MDNEFSQSSMVLNVTLSKTERQAQGIFFTPRKARNRLFAVLNDIDIDVTSILEPSFGSGEFLVDAREKYPKAVLYGVELNKQLFESVPLSDTLYNMSFLDYKSHPVDLIIGNPPYFSVKDKNPKCMTGHGNIYIQFLYKCLTEHLTPNGVLAFVLPTSLYNSSYYEPSRKYIANNTTIRHLETLNVNYYETTQPTILIVIQNTISDSKPFVFERSGHTYITPFYKELYDLVNNTTTIQALGCSIKTGEVVWNQEKDKLADTGTLIVYTTNIVDRKLVLDNLGKNKKQYIQDFHKPPMVGPAIVVSRGYGNSYRFVFANIGAGVKFYGENHINVIYSKANTLTLRRNMKQIQKSFENEKSLKFIQYFVGNGALSKTELETVFPIF